MRQGDTKPWGKGACFPCAPEVMITKKVKKELLKKKIKYGELGNVNLKIEKLKRLRFERHIIRASLQAQP